MPKKVKKTITNKKTVKTGLLVPVYSITGEKREDLPFIPKNDLKIVSAQIVAQAIRVYRAAEHQGTVSTKTRGEVRGSTRKIYRQKGTGKARHGAITAPIFVGGGITFGPKPHKTNLKFPQKMQQSVFSTLINDKLTNKSLNLLTGLDKVTGKTKEFAQFFEKLKLKDKKSLLILASEQVKARNGAQNLPNVTLRSPASVSFSDFLNHEYVFLAKEAVDVLIKRLERVKA